MTEDQKRDLIEFLKENLRIYIEYESVYSGCMPDSPSLYTDCKILSIYIAGEKITEVYL